MSSRLYRGSLHLTIPIVDELELRWFYSDPPLSFGGCMGDGGSALGAQLEAASLYAHRTEKCRVCKGTGFAFVVPSLKRADQMRMREYMKLLEIYETKENLPPSADVPCETCRGMGWTARLGRAKAHGPQTVNFSQSASAGASHGSVNEPDLTAADRYVRIRDHVQAFRAYSQRRAAILETFLSPEAEEEEILAFTEAGADLSRISKRSAAAHPERVSIILEEATEQAQLLLKRISNSWCHITNQEIADIE